MANETTTTTLDDLQQSFIAESRFIKSNSVLLSDYVTVRNQPAAKKGVLFPIYGEATHESVAEATDLTNQAISTSGTTVTPSEYGSMFTLTDVADMTSQAQVGADLARLAMEAKRDAINQAIFALFDGFSTAIGSSNTDITVALVQQAVRQLRIAKAPAPYYLAVTPHVLEDLLGLYAATSVTNISEVSRMAQEQGVLPAFHGCIPIVIDNLAAGTSAGQIDAADIKCGLFSPAAIGMAVGYDWRLETQRDASLRATELVATSYWSVAEIKDSYGIELLVDNKD